MSEYNLARNGNIINKKYLEYFLPTVLIALANNIAVMVDSIIVGNMLGSVSMAAINLLSPVTQLYFSMTILFGLGASTLISFAKGQNNKKAADRTFTTAVVMLVFLSAVFILTQFIFIDYIASALTPIPELRSELIKYYIPFIAGTPFSLLLPSAVHCIRSDARPKFASNLIIISNAINLAMDLVLMGLFHTGIIGSSIATVTGNVVAFCIMLTHFKSRKNTLHFDLAAFSGIKEFFGECASLFTTGISGALGTMLITVTTFYMNNAIQSAAGSEGMVAMSVISNCQIFVSAFVTGASQTMIPIVSTLLGEKDTEGIKYAFKRAVFMLLAASVAIMLIIEAAPAGVARLFGEKTAEEMAAIIPALRISALSFPGMAMSFLYMYYCTATRRKVMSLTISIVNGIVLTIPFAYILGRTFGITGLWFTFAAAQYGTWIAIAIMILVVIKKSYGAYNNVFLLEKEDENQIMSVSVNSDIPAGAVKSYMTDKLPDKVTDAIEELLANVFAVGGKKGKPVDVDIRINRGENDYVILLRSNGCGLNAEDFNNKYKSFDYTSVLGMNQVKVIC